MSRNHSSALRTAPGSTAAPLALGWNHAPRLTGYRLVPDDLIPDPRPFPKHSLHYSSVRKFVPTFRATGVTYWTVIQITYASPSRVTLTTAMETNSRQH